MDHYRLYFLRNDHIEQALVVSAPNDSEALDQAHAHRGARALELWIGARRVGRFEPTEP